MKRIAALLAASLAIGCYRVCAGLQLGKGRLRKDSESVAARCRQQCSVAVIHKQESLTSRLPSSPSYRVVQQSR